MIQADFSASQEHAQLAQADKQREEIDDQHSLDRRQRKRQHRHEDNRHAKPGEPAHKGRSKGRGNRYGDLRPIVFV
jgi:ribosome assembly protein YihI (activator of Der GTPase)